MDKASAERWVTISAMVVFAIYGYRRVIHEPVQPGGLSNLLGKGPPVSFGKFVTAWGFMYLVIAIMAEAAPGLGGGFAILVMLADVLNNGTAIFADIKQGGSTTATKPTTTPLAGTRATAATTATAAAPITTPSTVLGATMPTTATVPSSNLNIPLYAAPRTTPNGPLQ